MRPIGCAHTAAATRWGCFLIRFAMNVPPMHWPNRWHFSIFHHDHPEAGEVGDGLDRGHRLAPDRYGRLHASRREGQYGESGAVLLEVDFGILVLDGWHNVLLG